MTPTRIHHINFVVRDLDAAIFSYESRFGFPRFKRIEHGSRGSHIATAKIGETTFVLVCPYDPKSVPGRFLEQHGEGFFLLSLGVEDLIETVNEMSEFGTVRDGIEDWRVADVGTVFGAALQLTCDKKLS